MFIGMKSTPVNNDPKFLFLTFECPYCEKCNVLNKKYSRSEVVCTNLACRKVISLSLESLENSSKDLNESSTNHNAA